MKNKLTFLFITISLLAWSQTKGKITYKVSIDKKMIEEPYKNPENSDAKNEALEMLHESQPVEGYLLFKDSIALYYVEEKVEIPGWNRIDGAISITPSGINMSWYMAGGPNVNYSDWTRQYNISTSEAMGQKRRIIREPLDWDITEETKTIHGYLCYKAILKSKENRIAWFTYDLPFPHGPRGFNGLPGLVLVFENNKYTYEAIAIELDHPETDDITEPKEGELISEKEFKAWSKSIMSGN